MKLLEGFVIKLIHNQRVPREFVKLFSYCCRRVNFSNFLFIFNSLLVKL